MGRGKKANKSKSSKPKVVNGSDGKKKNTKLRALDELVQILRKRGKYNRTRESDDGSWLVMDADNLKKKTPRVTTVARAAAKVVRDPNSTVREIHLSSNTFADLTIQAKKYFLDSLIKSLSLKSVDFSCNNTDPNMAYYTKEILREKKLTHLDLRYCNIGDEEARVIANMALDVDNPIQSIDLEHNNISENCFYELAEKISYANKYLVIYICEGYNSEGNRYGGTLFAARSLS